MGTKKRHEEFLKNIVSVIASIPEKGDSGTVECPACKGIVHWTRARSNGHRWARCETENCIAFIE